MQAIAAAMFGGRSNDDGSALGPASGGGGGWDGATGSGMTHSHTQTWRWLCQHRKLSGSIFAFASRPKSISWPGNCKACRGIHSKTIRVITPQTAMESQPAMTKPDLRPGKQRSRIEIGAALLGRIGELIREILVGPHCAIISDSNVAPLFGDHVKQRLTSSGFQPVLVTIPAGETSKTLEQVGAYLRSDDRGRVGSTIVRHRARWRSS